MGDLPRLLASQSVFSGRLFEVTVDDVLLPNGVKARRELVRHPGAVCMVPVDDEGRLVLVRQYRHAAGSSLLELPAGTLEHGEEALATVHRELQEEIGLAAETVEPLGWFYAAPGYSTEVIQLFACRGLVPSALVGDEDEDIEVERLSLAEALAAIDSGAICDAKSMVGILLWLRRTAAEGRKVL